MIIRRHLFTYTFGQNKLTHIDALFLKKSTTTYRPWFGTFRQVLSNHKATSRPANAGLSENGRAVDRAPVKLGRARAKEERDREAIYQGAAA